MPHAVPYEQSPSASPVSLDPPKLPPIPRVASQHESREGVEEHGLPKQELGSTDGQTLDRKRPFFTMTRSSMGDKATARMGAKDESQRNSPTHIIQSPAASLMADGQAEDQQLRPVNAPYDPINSNYEYSHGHPRPKSAGSLNLIPQPRRPPPAPKPSQPAASSVSQPRHAKTKLNLLNPMSLLARRRSSQAVTEATSDKHFQTKNTSIPGMNLPDDYDPRIRGNVVHDFSAPRPGRSLSSNDLLSSADLKKNRDSQGIYHHRLSPNPTSLALPEEDSPSSVERQHTPVFKEHFEDDMGQEQTGNDGPGKQNASAFMYQLSLKESYLDPDSSSLPPFARNLPNRLSKAGEGTNPASSHSSNPPLEVVLEATLADGLENSVKASPPISPPKTRSRASSSTESHYQPSGLPKRLKSNASRFSFDMAGVGSSAQERLLEEKHRQKAKRKLPESGVSDISDINDNQDDPNDDERYSDYGDTDSDDGLEEIIPGVNADADDLLMPISLRSIENSLYPPPLISYFPSPLDPKNTISTSPKIPHDSQSDPMQYAIPIASPTQRKNSASISSAVPKETEPNLQSHRAPSNSIPPENSLEPPLAGLPSGQGDEDDDLYFDDGMIEDLENRDDQAFDESVFDDDTSRIYGLPLRDLRPQSETHQTSEHLGNPNLQADHASPTRGIERTEAEEDLARNESRDSFLEQAQRDHLHFSHSAGLTEDNLAAYHDALAFAANRAALNGEFNRRQSLTSPGGQDGFGNEIDSAPGMTPDDGRASQEITGLFYGQGIEDPEDFDFDDTLSDDPIIAAANAEALENDDDGFYGQEFGFFARATGSAEYANGGYFGSRGVEGIGRSHSGRVNFQEPSLTPITERSEWSNRNSAISLAMHGYSQSLSVQPTVSNPGLAQLADIISREEDNMSLSALMKLRRGAWGGSSTSLQSSSGSQNSGSPLNLHPTFPASLATTMNPASSSTFSLASSSGLNSSDSDASPSSPTITLTTQTPSYVGPPPPSYPPPPPPPSQPDEPLAPPRSSQVRGGTRGHSRHSSGAESVSYVHEMNGDGSRWVMEKRRLGEGGKVEVLGREILQGGRI